MSDVAHAGLNDNQPRLPFPKQGDGGFDQCWYPIALSEEVERGKIISREFLSGRVVIFRGENGVASVLSAYCSHFGADLSTGDVVGNNIRCPFHHWEYAQSGKCVHLPVGDAIPKTAGQMAFPTIEKIGVIWCFNGPEPLYEFPFVDVDSDEYEVRAVKIREFPTDPALFMCNTFDFQHFRVVHKLKLENDKDPECTFGDYRCRYDIKMSPPEGYLLDYTLSIVGTNKFEIRGKIDGRVVAGVYAGTPIANNRSYNFMVSCTPKAKSSEEAAVVEDFIERITALRDKIVSEDWPILSAMRHPRYGLLVKSDANLARFIAYLRRYPRFDPGKFIN